MSNCRFIGVIADTHGLLRREAVSALQGAERIIHAGDIGKAKVLEELRKMAPLQVIRGNIDQDDWAADIPEELDFEVFGRRTLLVHDLKQVPVVNTEEFDLVISGHSHKPHCYREGTTLFLNPGSAGPRRFSLPVTLAKLYPGEGELSGQIVELLDKG